MKQISYIFLFTLFIFHYSIANAIEVSGHLTENTIWSPEHNPYQVIENLYVDNGVTLTILPGTEIEIVSTSLTTLNDYDQKFWLPNNEAKMIWVDGNIIAVGTEQDSIHFTRMNDVEDDFWGCIYFTVDAEMPVFKHCRFEYSAGMGIEIGNTARAVITLKNGNVSVDKCYFYCNTRGVSVKSYPLVMAEVINSSFLNSPYHDSFGQDYWGGGRCNFNVESTNNPVLFANNTLSFFDISADDGYCVNNVIINGVFRLYSGQVESYVYNNFIENGRVDVGGQGDIETSRFFIKKNRIIGNGFSDGIEGREAYLEISDNYLDGCNLYTDFATSGVVTNNISNGGAIYAPGITNFSNNISYDNNSGIGICATYQRLACTNNISVNNQYAFEASYSFDNSIFLRNEELEQFSITGNPIFRNCIMDFPLDPPLIDGGGNIIVDSLQAQQIFEDIEIGDFHLLEGSIAIDAGFDTLGYYYLFDIENSLRVWDGDGDGNAVIDIGAYEYGAPQLGKIAGYITETDTGEPVDYVLIKADNEPGEFTFADSSGYFEIQLPEGTYDLYAERVFYEDNIIYTVTVNNEENTEIEFNMTSNYPHVGVAEEEVPNYIDSLNLTNYPNPFNPSTKIRFSLNTEITEDTENRYIEIFNIKGQRIREFKMENVKLQSGSDGRKMNKVTWNGTDQQNNPVASGVYFATLKAGSKVLTSRKMLLLK